MRLARVLLVAVALLGGCSGGDGGRSDDTLPPRASSTTSTTVDYSVPAEIDVAYVEKVMAALDHVYGDAIRILAREREITTEFLEHLAAIYTPSEFELAQRAWVRDAASGLRGLKDSPGDPLTDVERAVRLDRECLIVAVTRDFSASRTVPTETPQRFVALVPSSPGSLNPTPWLISFDGFVAEPAGAEPEQPCGE